MSTSWPAFMARMATSACSRVGRQMSTRSTDGSANERAQVGGGRETELVADRGELVRGAAEDDNVVHVGPLGVDGGVGLAEPGAQQRDLQAGRPDHHVNGLY